MIDLDCYLNKLSDNSFIIFLFHGVIEDINTGIRNYTRKHLPVSEFDNLIKRLKKKGNALSLDDVIWYYENGQLKSEQEFSYGKPVTNMIRWNPNGTLLY